MPDVDRNDDELLAELAAILPPPPPDLVAAGKDVFTWRTIDGELAALTFDSLLDEHVGAVRSPTDAPRVLTFEAASALVDLELSVVDGVRRLMGHLSPARAGELELVTDARHLTTRVDERGRFRVDLPVAAARVEMRIRFDDGTSIRTAATAI